MKQPAAKDALLKLVGGADVFVHSIRPDAIDRLGQIAMQRGEIGQILPDRIVDAIKLALDDALFRFLTGSEQHLSIALRQLALGVMHGERCGTEHFLRSSAHRKDELVCRWPREVERRDDEHDPQQCGKYRPGSNTKEEVHRGNPAVYKT